AVDRVTRGRARSPWRPCGRIPREPWASRRGRVTATARRPARRSHGEWTCAGRHGKSCISPGMSSRLPRLRADSESDGPGICLALHLYTQEALAMRSKLIHRLDGQRTFAVVFDPGDEVVQGIRQIAMAHRLSASQISAIGAFETAVLGYFEWERK